MKVHVSTQVDHISEYIKGTIGLSGKKAKQLEQPPRYVGT